MNHTSGRIEVRSALGRMDIARVLLRESYEYRILLTYDIVNRILRDSINCC